MFYQVISSTVFEGMVFYGACLIYKKRYFLLCGIIQQALLTNFGVSEDTWHRNMLPVVT